MGQGWEAVTVQSAMTYVKHHDLVSTLKGTDVRVRGHEVGEVRAFHFSLQNMLLSPRPPHTADLLPGPAQKSLNGHPVPADIQSMSHSLPLPVSSPPPE